MIQAHRNSLPNHSESPTTNTLILPWPAGITELPLDTIVATAATRFPVWLIPEHTTLVNAEGRVLVSITAQRAYPSWWGELRDISGEPHRATFTAVAPLETATLRSSTLYLHPYDFLGTVRLASLNEKAPLFAMPIDPLSLPSLRRARLVVSFRLPSAEDLQSPHALAQWSWAEDALIIHAKTRRLALRALTSILLAVSVPLLRGSLRSPSR